VSAVLHTYRVPLTATALMIVALAFWAWRDWQNFGEHVEERERHRALGISVMLAGALHSLQENGRLQPREIEKIVEHIIRDSPYQFLVLEQNGRRILEVGDVPGNLVLPSTETDRFERGLYLFSRKVHLHETAKPRSAAPPAMGEAGGPGSDDGEQLMIFGGDVLDHGVPKALEHIFAPLGIAILLLSASVAAWIMVIRSRLLAEQLRSERARSAHLEDLGLAAAGLAHETKNPLGIISGIAQQVARNPEVPEQSRSMIETIIDEVDKSASRLGHFMTFAKQRAINPLKLPIQELTERIAEILQPEFDAAGVKLQVDCPPGMILADEDMLRQVLVNLLLNSLQASHEGGSVEIRMERQGALATIVVADKGCGISPELLPDIFKPYVAGNPEGHGLGLAIVKRFVEDHGWTIRADSRLNRGTVITISGIRLFQGEKDSRCEYTNSHR
jgi:two-component system, NtrC family, sensor histidine kinase HydH